MIQYTFIITKPAWCVTVPKMKKKMLHLACSFTHTHTHNIQQTSLIIILKIQAEVLLSIIENLGFCGIAAFRDTYAVCIQKNPFTAIILLSTTPLGISGKTGIE